jgi:hypothetical protein
MKYECPIGTLLFENYEVQYPMRGATMPDISENFEIICTLMDYHEEDWEVLKQEARQISEWSPELVTVFYDTVFAYDKTASVFHEGERPKVEQTLARWIAELASGAKEKEFWQHQWIIALIHIQRGVRNIYVLGMMNRLQQVVLQKCMETYEQPKALRVYSAFLRLSGVIAALIAECYTELQEAITGQGLAMAGLNPGLVQRIRELQIGKMTAQVQSQE